MLQDSNKRKRSSVFYRNFYLSGYDVSVAVFRGPHVLDSTSDTN